MNEQLQTELAAWLTGLREGVEGAKGFVLEQAPDVLREMVLLARVQSTLSVVAFLAGIAAVVWVLNRCRPIAVRATDLRCDGWEIPATIFGTMFGALAIIGLGVGFAVNLGTCLTAWFAPRVYLIQEIARLIGQAKG